MIKMKSSHTVQLYCKQVFWCWGIAKICEPFNTNIINCHQRWLGLNLFKEKVKKGYSWTESRSNALRKLVEFRHCFLFLQLFERRETVSQKKISHSHLCNVSCSILEQSLRSFCTSVFWWLYFLVRHYSHRKHWKQQASGQTMRSRKIKNFKVIFFLKLLHSSEIIIALHLCWSFLFCCHDSLEL